jgi:hypothetical protein
MGRGARHNQVVVIGPRWMAESPEHSGPSTPAATVTLRRSALMGPARRASGGSCRPGDEQGDPRIMPTVRLDALLRDRSLARSAPLLLTLSGNDGLLVPYAQHRCQKFSAQGLLRTFLCMPRLCAYRGGKFPVTG